MKRHEIEQVAEQVARGERALRGTRMQALQVLATLEVAKELGAIHDALAGGDYNIASTLGMIERALEVRR